MFRRLLIANRGEIACRITRTAHRLGMHVIAVYSEVDAHALHVRLADEAWPLGPAAPASSYLHIERILAIARLAHAEAVHPGYGFLSERESFAAACVAAGVIFVGPAPASIAAMGSKAAAKERMRQAGVPVLGGYSGEEQSLESLERQALELGFPLIIKPSGGGGGKGMQIVEQAAQLTEALRSARRIAVSSFGDERLMLERYLRSPRHVEVQVLADGHGHTLHVLDRDCSVQRRHQKLIEEAPAPEIAPEVRERLGRAACAVAREIGYVGAGTVEFLLEGSEFFFMEMNTRLQVEHPVTEAVTGLDLVEWQLRIAAGERLSLQQSAIRPRGHAVEARVCAENPRRDFLPGAGRLLRADWPQLPDVRADYGFESGDYVPADYDSLLGKVIAHGSNRAQAIDRLRTALARTRIAGVPSNIGWLAAALDSHAFRAGPVSTAFVGTHAAELARAGDTMALAPFAAVACVFAAQERQTDGSPWALADGFRLSGGAPIEVTLRSDGSDLKTQVRPEASGACLVMIAGTPAARIVRAGSTSRLLCLRPLSGGLQVEALVEGEAVHVWQDAGHVEFTRETLESARSGAPAPAGNLTAVLPGVVVSVLVAPGERVAAGQPLLVIEAMKMEHAIRAPHAGVVRTLKYRSGERVKEGTTLAELDEER